SCLLVSFCSSLLSQLEQKQVSHPTFETPGLTKSIDHSDHLDGTQSHSAPLASDGARNECLTWHEEGMNLYMRLGAVGFGLGVMINDGFGLSSAWELSDPFCHSFLWIPKHALRLVWVLWQTYFVFKYHR
ncbi:unnamed protein product, partial [Dicrocoelium dendriticum]